MKESTRKIFPAVVEGSGGYKARVELLTDTTVKGVHEVICDIIAGGKSYICPAEFGDYDVFCQNVAASTVAAGVFDCDTDQPIGFMNVTPQQIQRSAFPICCRGNVIIRKEFTEKHIAMPVYQVYLNVMWCEGYSGNISRSPDIIRAEGYLGRDNMIFCSVIPRGVKMYGDRWAHDYLFFVSVDSLSFDHRNSQMTEAEVVSRAKTAVISPPYFRNGVDIRIEATVVDEGERSISIRPARENEINSVFSMLTSAAMEGDGFGVDEFPTYELFCKKFLLGRTLHIIERTHSSETVGVAVVGPSHFIRGEPDVAMMYIYILPGYRCQGHGSKVEEVISEHLSELGYTGVVTDMLWTKRNAYHVVRKKGYSSLGHIPFSAYVTGEGWTDAAVLRKVFLPKPQENVKAKL